MSETPSNTLQYRFDGPEEAPVLILGPSLGTTWHMWDRQVPELAQQWRVFRFDLPGHGGAPAHAAGSVADLTARLLATLDGLGVQRFGYAGCAFGGAVGIELALRHPERLASLALIAASPRFGTADEFRQRGVIVRTNGLDPIARSAPERWFTGGFAAAQPAITEWAVQMVRTTDPGCYISACEALAAFDVRGELGHVGVPTLVLVGSDDQVTGPAEARTLVAGIPDARLAVVPGASHLVPVEQPAAVTDLLVRHFNTAWQTAHDASTGQIPVPPAAHPAVHAAPAAHAGPAGSAAPVQPALAAAPVPAQAAPVPAPAAPVPPQAVPAPPQAAPAPPRAVPVAEIAPAVVPPQAHAQGRPDPYDAGLKVRREVLGDAHVDRQLAQADEFSGDFQELLTRYAWGEIWDRPGLDRRTRSCVTLTALVAGGHLDELAFHVRAALRNGLTPDEIKEVLLQAAVYCGVPAANSAFRVAQRVVREETTPPE
ncbi:MULTISPECIES: bifunctional 3-oxoadipate enol-lactonase/4-carboxymuconolactone decarboxylase PcaDC [Streptomyces]|uniref:bifunctional 3-oxoadipate enol-lactonase/4-carboxymuconolactone decarboxylase PcaDC n=1 Tax=Streptomyces TaxID=1883 RepID=UPI001EFA4CC5|nr:4-carboxymuconolactone decarboxylase [Streptomyces sp. CL12-4]MCG8965245.1 4-carboxymuconolactone decarboxylase [Streptomyces sp. CL12-4]